MTRSREPVAVRAPWHELKDAAPPDAASGFVATGQRTRAEGQVSLGARRVDDVAEGVFNGDHGLSHEGRRRRSARGPGGLCREDQLAGRTRTGDAEGRTGDRTGGDRVRGRRGQGVRRRQVDLRDRVVVVGTGEFAAGEGTDPIGHGDG